jgi:hypothetical protein
MTNKFVVTGWKYRQGLISVTDTGMSSKDLNVDQMERFLIGYFDKDVKVPTIEEVYEDAIKLNPIVCSVRLKHIFVSVTMGYIARVVLAKRVTFPMYKKLSIALNKGYTSEEEENVNSIW